MVNSIPVSSVTILPNTYLRLNIQFSTNEAKSQTLELNNSHMNK